MIRLVKPVCAAVLPLLCAATLAVAAGDSVLLRNATVHTVSGPVLEGADVLVVEGKIAGVGKRLEAPRGVPSMDLRGLHVYPGMINSGTPIGLYEIGAVRETLDVRELGDYNPQLRALVAVNPESEHIPVTRANGITSAVTIPDGGAISGQAALIHLGGWTWEEMAVLPSAALHIRFPVLRFQPPEGGRERGGPDSPKTFAEAEKLYQRKIQELHEFFEQARRYQQAKAAGRSDFESDPKLEAMLPVLAGDVPALVTAERRRTIRAALDFAEREKIRIILAHPRQVDDFLDELKKRDIPVIVGETLDLPLEEDDPYDDSYTLPARLHRAGIRFAFASFGMQFARNLPYQAAMAAAFGLPPEEALKAVTLAPAEIWGVAGRLGSIEEGKLADLIVTDGDPLEARTEIKHVFIEGKLFDPKDNKQYRLYEKYSRRPEP